MRRGTGGLLVAIGTFGWAASQWYLVWLFARLGGGPAAVGQYSAVLAIITPIFVVAQFGLRTVYLTLSSTFAWQTYLSLRAIGITLGAIVAALLLGIDPRLPIGLGAAVVFVKCADASLDILQGRIQRQGRLTSLGIFSIANSLGTVLAATGSVLATGSALAGVLSSGMVSTAVCICAWSSGKARSDDPTSERGGHKVILASGLPVMVSQGLASIASYLPILVLTRVSDPTFVGIFASAAYLLTFANLVGSSTQTIVLTPFRSTKEEAGSVALLARARKLAARMVLGGILSTVAVVGFGGRVLTSIYGEAFWLSPFQLFLLSLSAAAIPPAFMFSAVLSVLNAFRVEVWIWLVSCVVGLLSGLAMSTVNLSAIVVGVSVSAVVFLSRLGGVVLFAHAEVRSRVEPNDDDHHVRGL